MAEMNIEDVIACAKKNGFTIFKPKRAKNDPALVEKRNKQKMMAKEFEKIMKAKMNNSSQIEPPTMDDTTEMHYPPVKRAVKKPTKKQNVNNELETSDPYELTPQPPKLRRTNAANFE